jgi:hypothetical protein
VPLLDEFCHIQHQTGLALHTIDRKPNTRSVASIRSNRYWQAMPKKERHDIQ